MSQPECPKCGRGTWTASRRFRRNRHGRLQANLICANCHYFFWSGRRDALEAARAVEGHEEEPLAKPFTTFSPPQPSLPGVKPPVPFTRAARLVGDFKSRQGGEDDGDE